MAEGEGFEPSTPITQSKRLAGARTRPLCDPSAPSNSMHYATRQTNQQTMQAPHQYHSWESRHSGAQNYRWRMARNDRPRRSQHKEAGENRNETASSRGNETNISRLCLPSLFTCFHDAFDSVAEGAGGSGNINCLPLFFIENHLAQGGSDGKLTFGRICLSGVDQNIAELFT